MIEPDPIARFRDSYARAHETETFDVARAALATADRAGRPSLRFVLVKQFDRRGFQVYTNLDSRKGREMAENPHAALSFHWSSTGVQVRIEGAVESLSAEESDRYFATRPRGSQLGAWASQQSAPIHDRAELVAQVEAYAQRFEGQAVPRPPRWGGLLLVPSRIEFWQDQADRLHDRVLYTRVEARPGARERRSDGDRWAITLLSP